ncbi:uncharacterized protein LOC114526422 [Dendronephthya gigantea]|uniref:uncharacterized protein LOC114526422 n=1 Tax=Dendronephthya gigantea TaxID=151771 RepID=UPI00106DA197|nr:uncharacterized protein LOC114526422 [Dendronephthya gigantea]
MEIHQTYTLKELNTFGVDVNAKFFSVFKTSEELIKLLDEVLFDHKLLILGEGSNILFTQNYEGYVLKNDIKGIGKIYENEDEVVLRIGAGELWHKFVFYCIENNFGGVENMSLIPGTVGAAPVQNIGAFGVEQKDVFEKLEALNIATKKVEEFDADQCDFSYRDSFFKRHGKGRYVITNVYYRLSKRNHKMKYTSNSAIKNQLLQNKVDVPTIEDISKAVVQIRQSKFPNPAKIGNSGSFFKNPIISMEQFETTKEKYPEIISHPVDDTKVLVPAAWLIEKAGWKGTTFEEKYGVYKYHALVLVNYGGASGKAIQELAFKIMRDVELKFGIQLEAEVNIV